ncbi:CUGBP Elav-like family member 1 isoform X2 [Contarinia nasturtii]|nr:CUGBP Elav-like family member 1 isoform X2 [Contarinia nasturtii]XP_031627650.1 CUGBP Elav-like family member 1 isoform X2 [Contarinia nasturtii]
MLSKKYNEQEVRQLFSGYGSIEECTVLRDQNGQSKGCAFVTFATKQNALAAIKGLNQTQTMEGCSAPLVVKFADTQKEKEQKKVQQMQAAILSTIKSTGTTSSGAGLTAISPGVAITSDSITNSLSSANGNSATTVANLPMNLGLSSSVQANGLITMPNATALTSNSSLLTNPPQTCNMPFIGADALSTSSLQFLQQMQAMGQMQQQLLQGLNGAQLDTSNNPLTGSTAATHAGLLQPLSMQNLLAMACIGQSQLSPTASSQSLSGAQLGTTTTPLWSVQDYTTAALPQYASGLYAPSCTANALNTTASLVAGKQIEGPEGGNLFIYHLPQEFTDRDLAITFLPFGNVISAKVFIDKQTNLSKCFGFVSYDNATSAQSAIQAMHGFQIGSKRLKVQLKRNKDAAKPY